MDFLKYLIQLGANPHAKVDKLQFYRELDAHKRQLVRMEEDREGVDYVGNAMQAEGVKMIDTGGQNDQQQSNAALGMDKSIKTRQEVLAE